MTVVTICAYPWDLIGDSSAGRRLAATGAARVAIAAAYHSVRAATPLHPEHRLVDADAAALYVPVRAAAWAGKRLVPQEARPWRCGGQNPGTNYFGEAAETALTAGLEVDAWTVLLHSTVLGKTNPELCVRNAFGDIYTYALCPGNSDVIEYAATVVTEVAQAAKLSGATGLMIEACGPLGVGHQGHHEKTAGAEWSSVDEALLSLCFCAGCSEGMRHAGADPNAIASVARSAVGRGCTSVEAALGPQATVLRVFREATTSRLATRVADAARKAGMNRLVFHAQPDPWAVGPFVSLGSTRRGAGLPGAVSGAIFVLPGTRALEMKTDELSELAAHVGAAAMGAYVSALPPRAAEELAGDWKTLQRRGFDELCIYHFGLLSRNRLTQVGKAIADLAL